MIRGSIYLGVPIFKMGGGLHRSIPARWRKGELCVAPLVISGGAPRSREAGARSEP